MTTLHEMVGDRVEVGDMAVKSCWGLVSLGVKL